MLIWLENIWEWGKRTMESKTFLFGQDYMRTLQVFANRVTLPENFIQVFCTTGSIGKYAIDWSSFQKSRNWSSWPIISANDKGHKYISILVEMILEHNLHLIAWRKCPSFYQSGDWKHFHNTLLAMEWSKSLMAFKLNVAEVMPRTAMPVVLVNKSKSTIVYLHGGTAKRYRIFSFWAAVWENSEVQNFEKVVVKKRRRSRKSLPATSMFLSCRNDWIKQWSWINSTRKMHNDIWLFGSLEQRLVHQTYD